MLPGRRDAASACGGGAGPGACPIGRPLTRVVLLPEAEDDLADAAEFLDRRGLGLGERITDEVEHALGRIAENPRVGSEIGGGVRKLRTRRFPYNLIYRIEVGHTTI